MAVKGRSAKGVVVDFDLLRIKEQMSATPTSVDVRKRQDFIENRLRRRARKKVPAELLAAANEKVRIEVEKTMPAVEDEPAEMFEEESAVEPQKVTPKTKQRARPKSKNKKD